MKSQETKDDDIVFYNVHTILKRMYQQKLLERITKFGVKDLKQKSEDLKQLKENKLFGDDIDNEKEVQKYFNFLTGGYAYDLLPISGPLF